MRSRFGAAPAIAIASGWEETPSQSAPVSVWRCLSFAGGFGALFACAALLRLNPSVFDHPAAQALNRLAVDSDAASRLANLVTFPAVQGVAIVAVAWSGWFARPDPALRARIVRGAVAAVLAALAAHFVHELLPPLLKPIFDPGLQIRPPSVMGDIDTLRATANPNEVSFPSERATMFAALAIAIFTASRSAGLVALGGTAVVECCRVFLGLHYPSDMLGGFCLAATAVWAVEAATRRKSGRMIVTWERISAPTFYAAAFVASYCLATGFADVRELMARL